MTAVARHDARSLFERAWSRAMRDGSLGPQRRDALLAEGVRAMRRLAGVLGSEHLREDLQRAMRSMLGLVNLHLEKVSRGDVDAAARSIVEHGLLFHTKGASQAIKRVIVIEMGEEFESLDDETCRSIEEQVVTDWAFMPFAEFAGRENGADERMRRRGAALALSSMLAGQPPEPYYEPEQVILTALLVLACSTKRAWPADLKSFERLLAAARKTPAKLDTLPEGVPPAYRPIVERVWREHAAKLVALITDPGKPIHQLVAGNPLANPLLDLLVLPDTAIDLVEAAEEQTTSHWQALTGGKTDEANLLLVMLRGVLALKLTAPLGAKAAETLVRMTCAERPDERLLRAWLDEHAPHPYQDGLARLWDDFWTERVETLDQATSVEACRVFAAEWLPVRAAKGK